MLTALAFRYPPGHEPPLIAALRQWLGGWPGIGRIVTGMASAWTTPGSTSAPTPSPTTMGSANDPGNRNGNPSVSPADPSDPNGPRGYTGLPMPTLGCSRIDTLLHRGAVPLATQTLGCVNYPQMYTSPYPVAYNVPPGSW